MIFFGIILSFPKKEIFRNASAFLPRRAYVRSAFLIARLRSAVPEHA